MLMPVSPELGTPIRLFDIPMMAPCCLVAVAMMLSIVTLATIGSAPPVPDVSV